MNNSNDTRNWMEELGVFCYKVLTIPMNDIVLYESKLGYSKYILLTQGNR